MRQILLLCQQVGCIEIDNFYCIFFIFCKMSLPIYFVLTQIVQCQPVNYNIILSSINLLLECFCFSPRQVYSIFFLNSHVQCEQGGIGASASLALAALEQARQRPQFLGTTSIDRTLRSTSIHRCAPQCLVPADGR